MKTIYKYPLESLDIQSIEMPKFAEILTVQMQHGTPCIWALVEPSEETTARHIAIVGTGNEAPKFTKYIGTFQSHGWLVFHVFETSKP